MASTFLARLSLGTEVEMYTLLTIIMVILTLTKIIPTHDQGRSVDSRRRRSSSRDVDDTVRHPLCSCKEVFGSDGDVMVVMMTQFVILKVLSGAIIVM